MSEPHFITAANLVKIFHIAELEVQALQGLDLEVDQGEILALVGPSGSGKSTLLNALGGLDRPTAGRLEVGGRNLLKLNANELTAYRRETVGFVWQQTARNLLPYLTARENIELLMTLSGTSGRSKRQWANELLDAVDMTAFANQRPTQLSGGQQQRIAIACALANRPQIMLGDEPTGEVDWPNAQLILSLLRSLRERFGLTIVLVTHDPRVAEWADRTVAIRDGRTSTEIVRVAEDGAWTLDTSHTEQAAQATRHAEELVVLDTAGRLQIPLDQRLIAGIGRRAKVELVDGGILIRPGDDDRDTIPLDPGAASTPTATTLYSSEPLQRAKPAAKPRRWLGRKQK